MKMQFSPFLIMILAMITGCGSKIYVEKDPSANLNSYKTYMWVDTKASEQEANGRRALPYADQAVRQASRNYLQQMGWRETENNPEVLVSYDILVQRGTQQQSSPVYSAPFTRLYFNPYSRRYGTIYYPSQFVGYDTYSVPVREGTFTITMMDARTDKTLWQGWTTEQIRNRKPTPSEIVSTVGRIFKRFTK